MFVKGKPIPKPKFHHIRVGINYDENFVVGFCTADGEGNRLNEILRDQFDDQATAFRKSLVDKAIDHVFHITGLIIELSPEDFTFTPKNFKFKKETKNDHKDNRDGLAGDPDGGMR